MMSRPDNHQAMPARPTTPESDAAPEQGRGKGSGPSTCWPLRYLSVCSGIEAASVAWEPLGWEPVGFSEIEPFPSAVLAHRWPDVPNLGDMTNHGQWPDTLRPDLIVGGTPCQAFSVAGLRRGLADPRGNLTLVFLGILEQFRPSWVVWENVPGVLSDKTGAFGAFLGGLGELGYGFAYRVLDAQHFGVPQRRRRVFVVGCLGDWKRAAAVLFEPACLRGDSPPRREAGERVAPTLDVRAGRSGETTFHTSGGLIPETVGTICADSHPGSYTGQDAYTGRLVAHSLRAEGFDASEDGTGRGTPLVPTTYAATDYKEGKFESVQQAGPLTTSADRTRSAPVVAFSCKDHGADAGEQSPTLRSMSHDSSHANGGGQVAVAFQEAQTGVREYETAGTLRADGPGHDPVGTRIREGHAVRRLTPTECERLQGFPDGHTLIPWRGKDAEACPDGPRYKALGNSMAVPVMAWIGQRIHSANAESSRDSERHESN